MLDEYTSQGLTNNTGGEASLDVPVTPLKLSHYNAEEYSRENELEATQSHQTSVASALLSHQHSASLMKPGRFQISQPTAEPIALIQNIVATCSLGILLIC